MNDPQLRTDKKLAIVKTDAIEKNFQKYNIYHYWRVVPDSIHLWALSLTIPRGLFCFTNYGGGHKSGASMSALTLLAFLFFLHILQQCIKDHMTDVSTPPVMIMTAGREGEEAITKSATFNKIDKTGMTEGSFKDVPENGGMDVIKQNKITEMYGEKNPYESGGSSNKHQLMKIKTAHVTKSDEVKHKYVLKNYGNRSSNFAGFYSAMDEE